MPQAENLPRFRLGFTAEEKQRTMIANQQRADERKELEERINKAHAWLCEALTMTLPLSLDRRMQWEHWFLRGHTYHELRAVIVSIRRGISEGSRNIGALRFENLIGNVSKFEEELSLIQVAENVAKRTKLPDLPDAIREVAKPVIAAVTKPVSADDVPNLEEKRRLAQAQFAKLRSEVSLPESPHKPQTPDPKP